MTELLSALHALPQSWALTPVAQKKAYVAGWQQTGLAREAIAREITSGKADGYGILTGPLSGGLIAIDCDGHQPHARFKEILGGDIPRTVSFASGKDGRAQYLFSVPEEQWANISTRKEGEADNGGQLEFRWISCQSVLPPSAHPETAGYNWVNSPDECLIAPLPDKALEYLQNLCKPSVKPSAKPEPKTATNAPPIPLERCLSKAHRDALENGGAEGNRSNTAIALARDLLGCAHWLENLDEPYSGEARALYDEFCDRCSPPFTAKDGREATWKSAQKYSAEPSISDPEAFQNCIDGWKREHGPKNSAQPAIDEDESQGDQLNVKRLLAANDYDPLSAIAEPLRGKIKKECERWSLPPLVYISVLLPMVLSLSKVDTILNARETKGRPILWVCLVGSSNSGKSESSGSMISPLESLQDDATDDFELKLAEFTHEKKLFDEASRLPAAKRTDKQNDFIEKFSDVEPSCREYYLSDYTHEVVGKVLKPQKANGLLIYMDELKPFFCFDRYTNGSGNRARTLQWYDAKGIKINRKGQERIHLSKTAISIIGTTQPSTLEALLKEDPNMEDGLWARLTLIHVPTTPTYSHDPEDSNDLGICLKRIYGDLRNNQAFTFTLSSDAKQTWAKWYDETVDSSIRQNSDFLASIYGKAKDRAARVALAIHLLNAAVRNETPSPEVSAETLQHAIAINRMFLHDTEKLLGLVGATTELDESRIIKFVTKFEGKKSVNTTDAKSWWPTKIKPARQQVRDFMKSIADLGLATGNGLEHTDPKYEISINKSLGGSSIRPKSLEELPANNPRVIHESRPQSSGFVHSPISDEDQRKARLGQTNKQHGDLTTADDEQTKPLVNAQSTSEKELQPEVIRPTTAHDVETVDDIGRTRTTNPDDIESVIEQDLQEFRTNGRTPMGIEKENPESEEQTNYIPLGEIEDDY